MTQLFSLSSEMSTQIELSELSTLKTRLDFYYQQIHTVILARQNPVTGLLPASTAVNEHGDYRDAWVRDNVYSILAVWGLALAYRKVDEDQQGRGYELEQSVVKLMRGLLLCMMRQSNKVERFKETQDLMDALHAKYDTHTGQAVVRDDEWGHLQIDATSIFLLMLAQMIASGLQIIYTIDEVNFIQNLVYYIGRAYRTPDYGIWERGNKINHGKPELNVSSVGMAKAALEAMNGFNLFGVKGGQSSVIHVLPDEIARARITLESLLPRESGSKEVDAAVLSVIGFPAFAVENPDVVQKTRDKIVDKLQGRYGCKRFLRDGHQTMIEDTSRLHYEPWELKQFEHIECEWPLFFTYLMLDGLFRQDQAMADDYHEKLRSLLISQDGMDLLPEVYYVPADKLEAERQAPQSQTRLPNDNVPLVWAQSLYYLGELRREGLLTLGEVDPLGRHLRLRPLRRALVQVALIAEDEDLQAELATYGIDTQTPAQIEPMQVRQSRELSAVYQQIGRNQKLGLTGRPVRRLRSLTTAKVFRIGGTIMVFLPSFLDQQQFYLMLDYHFLVSQIQSEIAYIHTHWNQKGRPTVTLRLTHAMFEIGQTPGATIEQSPLLQLIKEMQDGCCGAVPVRLGTLQQLVPTAGFERIDNIHDWQFLTHSMQGTTETCDRNILLFDLNHNWPLSHTQEFRLECETSVDTVLEQLRQSRNLYEQIELLSTLHHLKGLDFKTPFYHEGQSVTVATLLNEVYERAGALELWAIVRRAAGLLDKVDIGLSDAVTDILVRQKQIAVGKAYSEDSLITEPMSHYEIMDKIREFCGEDMRDRVLTQELLIYLSILIKSEPQLFEGLLTLRINYLILLLVTDLARELNLSSDEAYEQLMQLSPFQLKLRLKQVLTGYAGLNQSFFQRESLHLKQKQQVEWVVLPQDDQLSPEGGWRQQRHLDGAITRVPTDFYARIWRVLKHCRGVVIGDKLERRNRLDSDLIRSEMTPGEKNLALRIEHLLNKIPAPEYRQLNIETLLELAEICDRNPDLQIEDYITLDVLIGHAVRLSWLEQYPERGDRYDEDKATAWNSFYESSPYRVASSIAKALQFLTELGGQSSTAA